MFLLKSANKSFQFLNYRVYLEKRNDLITKFSFEKMDLIFGLKDQIERSKGYDSHQSMKHNYHKYKHGQ